MFAYFFLLGLLPLAVIGRHQQRELYPLDAFSQHQLWEDYKRTYHRKYEPTEEAVRISVFSENLKKLNELHSAAYDAGLDTKYSITQFSDLSREEFKKKYLNTKPPSNDELASIKPFQMQESDSSCAVQYSTVNWAGKLTTPVKKQGQCGSCWSFAAAEQVESDIMRTYGENATYILSEQQLLDCDTEGQNGCDGGVVSFAFEFWTQNYVEQNSTYPYVSGSNALTGTCSYNPDDGVAIIKDYYALSRDETCMAVYVQTYGPAAAAVNADSWEYYGGGLWTAEDCGYGTINHAVQIVGVNIPDGYWIIRNTWGTTWGEDGYIHLEFGVNACNITDIPALMTDPYLLGTPTSSDSNKKSLSAGAIAGIVIAIVIVVGVIVGVLIWYCVYRKKEYDKPAENIALSVSENL